MQVCYDIKFIVMRQLSVAARLGTNLTVNACRQKLLIPMNLKTPNQLFSVEFSSKVAQPRHRKWDQTRKR